MTIPFKKKNVRYNFNSHVKLININRKEKNLIDLFQNRNNRLKNEKIINDDLLTHNITYNQVTRFVAKYITGHCFYTPKKSK